MPKKIRDIETIECSYDTVNTRDFLHQVLSDCAYNMLRHHQVKNRDNCERLASQLAKEVEWRYEKPIFRNRAEARRYLNKVAEFEPGTSVAVRYYVHETVPYYQKLIRDSKEKYKKAKAIEQKCFIERKAFADQEEYDTAHRVYRLGLEEIARDLRKLKSNFSNLPTFWLVYLSIDFNDLD